MDRMLDFLDALHEDVEVKMTDGERDFIRSFTARHCRPAGRIKFVLVGEDLGY